MITMDFAEKKGRKKAERREHDAYMTPMPLVESIVSAVRIYVSNPKNIVEPSCGTGEFVSAAHRMWPEARVVGVDIRPEVGEHFKSYASNVVFVAHDFLTLHVGTLDSIDLFLGNPPFAFFKEFVSHILDGMKDGATLVFLARINILVGSLDLQAWWLTPRSNGMTPNRQIVDMLPIFPRPSFTGGGTDATEYGVIIFRKGFDNGGRFEPIQWTKPEKRGRKKKATNGAPVPVNPSQSIETPMVSAGKTGGDLFGGES